MTDVCSGWSDEAVIWHKHRSHERELARWSMERGPRLLEDGYTLAIPSEAGYYKPQASETWKKLGFGWDKEAHTWMRDTRIPLPGYPGYPRPYRAEVWLKSVRKRFYQLYLELGIEMEVDDGV